MADEQNQQQPGTVISPGGTTSPPVEPAKPEPVAPETPPAPPDTAPEQPPAQVPTGLKEDQPEPEDGGSEEPISWTASEFVAHEKSTGWYLMLMIAAVLIGALVYLVTKDIISVGVVMVAALLLGIYGTHKPRQLEYRLDAQGINIGDKHYAYDHFRSFSVVPEGAFHSIVFMPLKRFSVPISIYYAPEDEDKIADMLTHRLPFEEARLDNTDRLMRRIRF